MMPSVQELKTQLDYLVRQVQSSIADPVRPTELREAIDRSKRLLRRCDEIRAAE